MRGRRQMLRSRARWIVGILYLGGFIVLTVGMFISPSGRAYGAGFIGMFVLAFSLGITYGISRLWVGGMGTGRTGSAVGLVILLSLPVILWLAVTGLCVATGLPIPGPAGA